MKKHQVDYRVYYEDTDAGGIMYHSNFINFCERGRSELLRYIGIPASEVMNKTGVGFVVRYLEANYTAMARLDDLLSVFTTVKAMKNTSFVMEQEILCQNSTAFKMDITIVCINENGKPTRIPEELRTKFKEYMKEENG